MKSSEKPCVELGDWITIGQGTGVRAVVSAVHEDNKMGDIEVVYLDYQKRAINEDVIWKDDAWEFRTQDPGGGYADKYSRLSEYVAILRYGRYGDR
ncbi:MAG: hypothetical protein ABIE43_03585 [Patescibacteria group bacterium]